MNLLDEPMRGTDITSQHVESVTLVQTYLTAQSVKFKKILIQHI